MSEGKKDILTFLSSNTAVLILSLNVFIIKMWEGGRGIHSPASVRPGWSQKPSSPEAQPPKGAFEFHE